MPSLYSGCYGLARAICSRKALIAASRICCGRGAPQVLHCRWISCAMIGHAEQEIRQQDCRALSERQRAGAARLRESHLLPKGAIAVPCIDWRLGAVTTGKNLAMTLFERSAGTSGQSKRFGEEGTATTYYLSAATEPIRINCEYTHVAWGCRPTECVLHTNALKLNKNGCSSSEQPGQRGSGVGDIPDAYPEIHCGQQYPRVLSGSFRLRAKNPAIRPAAAHAATPFRARYSMLPM